MVLVAFVARRVNPAEVADSWRGMSLPWATATVGCFLLAMGVRVTKWAWQLRCLGLGFDSADLVRNFLVSVLLGAVTPMRAGEAYRLAAVRFDPARKAEQMAVVGASLLLEKGFEVLVLVAMVAAGFVLAGSPYAAPLVGVVVVGGVLGLAPVRPPAGLVARLPNAVRRLVVEPVLRARDGVPLGPRLGIVALTAAAHLLNLVAALGVYRAFGPMPLDHFLLRMPLVTLTNVVPVSVGGIGVREATAMQLFGSAGFPASSAAVAASLVFLGANVLPAVALLVVRPRRVAAVVDEPGAAR